MNSFSYNNKKNPRLLIGIFILIILVVCFNFFSKGVRNFFYTIASPVQKIFWQAGNNSSTFFGALIGTNNLANSANELAIKNQELFQQKSATQNLSAENQVLRQALSLGLQKDFSMVYSQIISKDLSGDSILIDKGSADGISKNMAVISEQRILFGKISEVYKNFSKVDLITAKNFVVDAVVQGKVVYGAVKGSGNLAAYFDLISKDAGLEDNDTLLTSSLGGDLPKNLLVGLIENIKKEDTKPFQSAEIKPFFDLNIAESLFVITDFKKN